MKLTPVAYGGLDSCFLTFANIHMEILLKDNYGWCFRLQSGNVLSERGGSEYTSGPTAGESTSVLQHEILMEDIKYSF